MVAFCRARCVLQPLHSSFNVWLCDTKQRADFTAEPSHWLIGWFANPLEPGWETLAVHLLLNCPVCLFESDTGTLAKDQGHTRSTLL